MYQPNEPSVLGSMPSTSRGTPEYISNGLSTQYSTTVSDGIAEDPLFEWDEPSSFNQWRLSPVVREPSFPNGHHRPDTPSSSGATGQPSTSSTTPTAPRLTVGAEKPKKVPWTVPKKQQPPPEFSTDSYGVTPVRINGTSSSSTDSKRIPSILAASRTPKPTTSRTRAQLDSPHSRPSSSSKLYTKTSKHPVKIGRKQVAERTVHEIIDREDDDDLEIIEESRFDDHQDNEWTKSSEHRHLIDLLAAHHILRQPLPKPPPRPVNRKRTTARNPFSIPSVTVRKSVLVESALPVENGSPMPQPVGCFPTFDANRMPSATEHLGDRQLIVQRLPLPNGNIAKRIVPIVEAEKPWNIPVDEETDDSEEIDVVTVTDSRTPPASDPVVFEPTEKQQTTTEISPNGTVKHTTRVKKFKKTLIKEIRQLAGVKAAETRKKNADLLKIHQKRRKMELEKLREEELDEAEPVFIRFEGDGPPIRTPRRKKLVTKEIEQTTSPIIELLKPIPQELPYTPIQQNAPEPEEPLLDDETDADDTSESTAAESNGEDDYFDDSLGPIFEDDFDYAEETVVTADEEQAEEVQPRKRGRPRKHPVPTEEEQLEKERKKEERRKLYPDVFDRIERARNSKKRKRKFPNGIPWIPKRQPRVSRQEKEIRRSTRVKAKQCHIEYNILCKRLTERVHGRVTETGIAEQPFLSVSQIAKEWESMRRTVLAEERDALDRVANEQAPVTIDDAESARTGDEKTAPISAAARCMRTTRATERAPTIVNEAVIMQGENAPSLKTMCLASLLYHKFDAADVMERLTGNRKLKKPDPPKRPVTKKSTKITRTAIYHRQVSKVQHNRLPEMRVATHLPLSIELPPEIEWPPKTQQLRTHPPIVIHPEWNFPPVLGIEPTAFHKVDERQQQRFLADITYRENLLNCTLDQRPPTEYGYHTEFRFTPQRLVTRSMPRQFFLPQEPTLVVKNRVFNRPGFARGIPYKEMPFFKTLLPKVLPVRLRRTEEPNTICEGGNVNQVIHMKRTHERRYVDVVGWDDDIDNDPLDDDESEIPPCPARSNEQEDEEYERFVRMWEAAAPPEPLPPVQEAAAMSPSLEPIPDFTEMKVNIARDFELRDQQRRAEEQAERLQEAPFDLYDVPMLSPPRRDTIILRETPSPASSVSSMPQLSPPLEEDENTVKVSLNLGVKVNSEECSASATLCRSAKTFISSTIYVSEQEDVQPFGNVIANGLLSNVLRVESIVATKPLFELGSFAEEECPMTGVEHLRSTKDELVYPDEKQSRIENMDVVRDDFSSIDLLLKRRNNEIQQLMWTSSEASAVYEQFDIHDSKLCPKFDDLDVLSKELSAYLQLDADHTTPGAQARLMYWKRKRGERLIRLDAARFRASNARIPFGYLPMNKYEQFVIARSFRIRHLQDQITRQNYDWIHCSEESLQVYMASYDRAGRKRTWHEGPFGETTLYFERDITALIYLYRRIELIAEDLMKLAHENLIDDLKAKVFTPDEDGMRVVRRIEVTLQSYSLLAAIRKYQKIVFSDSNCIRISDRFEMVFEDMKEFNKYIHAMLRLLRSEHMENQLQEDEIDVSDRNRIIRHCISRLRNVIQDISYEEFDAVSKTVRETLCCGAEWWNVYNMEVPPSNKFKMPAIHMPHPPEGTILDAQRIRENNALSETLRYLVGKSEEEAMQVIRAHLDVASTLFTSTCKYATLMGPCRAPLPLEFRVKISITQDEIGMACGSVEPIQNAICEAWWLNTFMTDESLMGTTIDDLYELIRVVRGHERAKTESESETEEEEEASVQAILETFLFNSNSRFCSISDSEILCTKSKGFRDIELPPRPASTDDATHCDEKLGLGNFGDLARDIHASRKRRRNNSQSPYVPPKKKVLGELSNDSSSSDTAIDLELYDDVQRPAEVTLDDDEDEQDEEILVDSVVDHYTYSPSEISVVYEQASPKKKSPRLRLIVPKELAAGTSRSLIKAEVHDEEYGNTPQENSLAPALELDDQPLSSCVLGDVPDVQDLHDIAGSSNEQSDALLLTVDHEEAAATEEDELAALEAELDRELEMEMQQYRATTQQVHVEVEHVQTPPPAPARRATRPQNAYCSILADLCSLTVEEAVCDVDFDLKEESAPKPITTRATAKVNKRLFDHTAARPPTSIDSVEYLKKIAEPSNIPDALSTVASATLPEQPTTESSSTIPPNARAVPSTTPRPQTNTKAADTSAFAILCRRLAASTTSAEQKAAEYLHSLSPFIDWNALGANDAMLLRRLLERSATTSSGQIETSQDTITVPSTVDMASESGTSQPVVKPPMREPWSIARNRQYPKNSFEAVMQEIENEDRADDGDDAASDTTNPALDANDLNMELSQMLTRRGPPDVDALHGQMICLRTAFDSPPQPESTHTPILPPPQASPGETSTTERHDFPEYIGINNPSFTVELPLPENLVESYIDGSFRKKVAPIQRRFWHDLIANDVVEEPSAPARRPIFEDEIIAQKEAQEAKEAALSENRKRAADDLVPEVASEEVVIAEEPASSNQAVPPKKRRVLEQTVDPSSAQSVRPQSSDASEEIIFISPGDVPTTSRSDHSRRYKSFKKRLLERVEMDAICIPSTSTDPLHNSSTESSETSPPTSDCSSASGNLQKPLTIEIAEEPPVSSFIRKPRSVHGPPVMRLL